MTVFHHFLPKWENKVALARGRHGAKTRKVQNAPAVMTGVKSWSRKSKPCPTLDFATSAWTPELVDLPLGWGRLRFRPNSDFRDPGVTPVVCESPTAALKVDEITPETRVLPHIKWFARQPSVLVGLAGATSKRLDTFGPAFGACSHSWRCSK